MKKKSVRRVSSVKKVISKTPLKKKKSFSLRSWLLGSLVLVAALSYGLYQYNLQPKGIKVLEISGTVFDYLEPSKATIYKIVEVEPGLAKNDLEAKVIDKLNKSVNKVERADKTNDDSLKEESLKELIEIGTAYQLMNEPDSKLSQELGKETRVENQYQILIDESQERLANDPYYNNPIPDVVSNTNDNATNNASNISVEGGGSCSTSAFAVGDGETVIGASDLIYRCDNGIWSPVWLDLTGQTQCTTKDTDEKCKISVKPIYLQDPNKKDSNCYENNGSFVVGNGSVRETGDGVGRRCDGGDMTSVKKIDGTWMSEEDQRTDCEDDGVSTWSYGDHKCNTPPATNIVNPNGKFMRGGETTTNPSDCYYGSEPVKEDAGRVYRCHDYTGTVPTTTLTPTVPDPPALSGIYRAGDNVVNPNGKFKRGGETTTNPSDCYFGSEPVKEDAGRVYRCHDYTGTTPRTYNPAAAPGVFGNNPPSNQSPANTSSNSQPPRGEFDNMSDCKDDENYAGFLKMTCAQKSDGNWIQVLRNDPNLDCNGFRVFIGQPNCIWNETNTSNEANLYNANNPNAEPKNNIDIPPYITNPVDKSLKSGEKCDDGWNSSCESGDCRNIFNPSVNSRGWYCMSNTNLYTTDVVQGTHYKKKNGSICTIGGDSVCASGFCSRNVFFNTCEDNPFTTTLPSIDPEKMTKDEVKIENLQNKIQQILAKDRLAFSESILTEDDCKNKDCIPVPNNPGSFVETSVVLDKAREMEIELDFDR